MKRASWTGSGLPLGACRHFLAVAAAFLCLTGCTGFGEDFKESVSDFVYRPDPLTEVKSATAGDRKAKFLGQLQEPLSNGGNQKDQDEVVGLLIAHATQDPFPACRLQAIRALGKFKDPRAATTLADCYYKTTAFAPEINNLIRQQTLHALAETRSAVGRDVLLKVAQAQAEQSNLFDHKLTQDERLAAIRGLAHYKDEEVAQRLVQIARSDKDVALRERSRETLEVVTGRTLPDDPQQIDDAARNRSQGNVATVSWTTSIRRALGWQ